MITRLSFPCSNQLWELHWAGSKVIKVLLAVWVSPFSKGYLICLPSFSFLHQMPTVSHQIVITWEPASTPTSWRSLCRDFQTFSYFCGNLWNSFQWVNPLENLGLTTRFVSQWQSHYCYARGNPVSHLFNLNPHFTLWHCTACWQLTVVWFPLSLWPLWATVLQHMVPSLGPPCVFLVASVSICFQQV